MKPINQLWKSGCLGKFIISLIAVFAVFGCGIVAPPGSDGTTTTPVPSATSSLVAADTSTAQPSPVVSTDTPERTAARVVEVVDGDTIKVEIAGKTYTVRYIGIDTPETKHPNRSVEWMGLEASEDNRRLVEGQTVYLEKDVSEVDRYGRLLRYVYLSNGLFVNAELLQRGYARVSTYPPDVRYQDLFLQLEREAREAGRGLWGQMPVLLSTPTASQAHNCDPAYPDVCIPSPPPDLNCKDIPHRRFRVLPPDPHRFDQDGDGVGCEG